MEKSAIIDFINEYFSNDREKLVPLLHSYDWNNSVMNEIYTSIKTKVDRPMQVCRAMNEDRIDTINKLMEKEITMDESGLVLGDISDCYTIVLNPEMNHVEDWDFEEYIRNDKEVRTCRVWVCWFLPVYYLEVVYEKGFENGSFWQYGPVRNLSDFESSYVDQIKEILANFNYKELNLTFLFEEMKGITTDCSGEKATIFDCIFSDFSDPWNEHIRKNKGSIKDLYDDNLTISIREYLNDDFEVIRKERTLHYNIFGNVTIITDNTKEVKEVICRGYIEGMMGNKKVIKIANDRKPDFTYPLPEPWYWTDQDLSGQLYKEITNEHILFGKKVKTLARRQDKDDVLYEVDNSDLKYAVVHLTWSENFHEDGNFPITTVYEDWVNVYADRIVIDRDEFKA
jgi:hypothetical protein